MATWAASRRRPRRCSASSSPTGRPQHPAARHRPLRPLHPRPQRLPAARHPGRSGRWSRATSTRDPGRSDPGGRRQDRPRVPRRHRPQRRCRTRAATRLDPDDGDVADPVIIDGVPQPRPAGTYDDELLDAHFIAGDGRVNENIGLTAVHHIFHSEHNRLVDDIDGMLQRPDAVHRRRAGRLDTTVTGRARRLDYGERLFQAARFVTEMEYQHLAFEEFARKVQPMVNLFGEGGTGYHTEHQPGDPRRVRPRRLPLRPLDADRDRRPHRRRPAARTTSRCSTPSSTRRRSSTAAGRARRTRRPATSCAA